MKSKLKSTLLVDDDDATNFLHKMVIKKLDCTEEVEEEKEEFTDEENKIIESITNNPPSNKEKPEVSVQIDEDGVDIKVNDN